MWRVQTTWTCCTPSLEMTALPLSMHFRTSCLKSKRTCTWGVLSHGKRRCKKTCPQLTTPAKRVPSRRRRGQRIQARKAGKAKIRRWRWPTMQVRPRSSREATQISSWLTHHCSKRWWDLKGEVAQQSRRRSSGRQSWESQKNSTGDT